MDGFEDLKIPQELAEEVTSALTKLCIFLHEETKRSHVVLDIHHLSDCLERKSQTVMLAGAAGVPVTPGEKPPPVDAAQAKTMVDDLVKNMTDKAKEKAKEDKPEPEEGK